ncbi:hypothetical protein PR048_016493 [Dryococelus australis]|uniref:Reverse transcriptase domain-containing protein n=1 Tax=Dryococelus australis TaxID=614101 RepID=A0ABQ9HJW3_9NEOP|nr:hypothetical protein PR048_016493 [Dryococelus australis]
MKGQTSLGPDGITASDWGKVPDNFKICIFNLFLLAETIPEWIFAARMVLILKASQPTVATDFRIQNGIKIKPEQRAFIENDGQAKNIMLLVEVLHTGTSWGKPLYAAVLDVRKAFDMVSHTPLMEILRARGLPHNILRHIWQMYLVGKTTIQLPGVPVKQWMKQGDPLYPILFNIVMDEALRDQEASVGFRLGGEVASRQAFADDVVLLVGSRAGLHNNLYRMSRVLEQFGLRLSAAKSFSLAMAAGPLERIYSALLKPYQRIELLKVFLLPSLIYHLSLVKVTMGTLKACDVIIRAAVCRWLRLPHDTALGFFPAACSAGGLGIPSLVRSVPVWILGRLRNVLKSNYPPARELENHPLFSRRVEWARAVATVGGITLDTSLKVKNYWRARASGIPSRDYLSYLHIISNSLSLAVRTSRCRRGPTGALPKCHAGCNDAETTYHVVQQCPRTNETRVARHNQADRLEELGYRVLWEPRYRTSEGVRVSNLVVSKPEEDVALVLDVQVVQSKGMDWSFSRKRAIDAGNKDLDDGV